MRRSTEEFDSGSADSSSEETASTTSSNDVRPSAAANVPNGVAGGAGRLGGGSDPRGDNVINANSTNPSSPPSLNAGAVAGGRIIANNPMDERVEVERGENVATPRALAAPRHRNSGSDEESYEESEDEDHQGDSQAGATAGQGSGVHGGRNVVYNAPHDEAIPVPAGDETDDEESVPTPVQEEARPAPIAAPAAARPQRAMVPQEESEEEEDEDDEEALDQEQDEPETMAQPYKQNLGGQVPAAIDHANAGAQPATEGPNREYDPNRYARVNSRASPQVRELFKRILDYKPFVAELPAKLRPFIPDYLPAVGDLDPFVKVPRPDGHPDGLGLQVVDEPAILQSNPAVVLLELRATNAHVASGAAQVVDSFEDAANRPEVIDRWINDVKKVHYKKPLPTVVYQKPMPDIDTLLQAWPQMFEDALNSDVQFPSPNIDLDLNQYVRTLCAILDIPTHTSLIDSLHVMFTLYEEFRGNQHFQHE